MRPSPDEVMTSVRSILKTDLAPLMPAAAQPQLKRVIAVLRDGRWNDAAFDLLRENAAFAELARTGADRLMDEPMIAAELGIVADGATRGLPVSFVQANEINRSLRAALSQAVEAARTTESVAVNAFCELVGATLLALREA